MQLLLILQFPLLTHWAVLSDEPNLKLVASGLLVIGITYTSLAAFSRMAWLVTVGLLVVLLGIWHLELIDWLIFSTPILIPLVLLGVFGTTLRPGAEALVTQIGERARGPLTAEMRLYTRHVTWLWTIVFLILTLEATLLAAHASVSDRPATWSWVVNIANPIMISALFVIEFIYRKKRFPDHPHPSFTDYLAIVRNAR